MFSSAEARGSTHPKWLFHYDTLDLLWAFARKLSLHPPAYENKERQSNLRAKPRRPPVTLYRMFVSACVLSFGLSKAAVSYLGRKTEPSALEWFLGVVVTIGYGSTSCLLVLLKLMKSQAVYTWLV